MQSLTKDSVSNTPSYQAFEHQQSMLLTDPFFFPPIPWPCLSAFTRFLPIFPDNSSYKSLILQHGKSPNSRTYRYPQPPGHSPLSPFPILFIQCTKRRLILDILTYSHPSRTSSIHMIYTFPSIPCFSPRLVYIMS